MGRGAVGSHCGCILNIYGGLKAVAMTDVIQVVVLVAGGIVTKSLAVSALSDTGSVVDGFNQLCIRVPE